MFFFIIGTRSRANNVALLQLACRNGHVAAHRIVKVTRWFTIFFIPLIPFNRRYLSVCSACGAQLRVPKDAAEEMIAKAGGGISAPVADPVAPPLPSLPAGSTASAAPPAGWYPDPAGSGGQRWWDGSKWTETVQPGPVAG